MFNGFFSENAHLIKEDCGPYKASTIGDSCKHYSQCQPIAKVKSSRFLDQSSKQQKID
jgi:hypothetical protein